MNHFRGHNLFPSLANVSRERSKDELDRFPQYSNYPGPPPGHRSTSGANSAWDRPGSSFQNWHKEEEEDEEDPDGQPYESDEEDPELARKRKELQEIQEQILLKRASLALKTIDFETINPGLCTEEARPTKLNEALRDRVKRVLMQRNRVIKSKSPVAKTRRSSINIQHDHPLKHRVKLALEQRFVVGPPVEAQHFEEMAFLIAPPRPQIESSPAEEDETGNQGFMRFLNILNKGVDIDKLKEMVIDEIDSTPQQPHKSPNGGEMPGEMSALSSPPETKRQQKEEPLPNPEEQQKHLKNILESLGLSLGKDEISKLADRTQERLYGKRQRTKEEDKKEDEPQQKEEDDKVEKEEEEKYSPAHHTRSSSDSSTSSSSSLRTPPRKQSPVKRQRSRSSSRRRRRSVSPYRHRSPHLPHRYRRSPGSPHRRSRSRSPYQRRNSRRRDSRSPHRCRSPHPKDHRDPFLQFQAPTQPYPPSQYFSPHFSPQMYPDPYSQYVAYYNYWVHKHLESSGQNIQNYPQSTPPFLPHQQLQPHNSNSLLGPAPEESDSTSSESASEKDDLPNTSNSVEESTRCLVTIKQICLSEHHKSVSKSQNTIPTLETKPRKTQRHRGVVGVHPTKPIDLNVQDCTKDLNGVTAAIKQAKYPNIFETAGKSGSWVITRTKKKKKRKKKRKLVSIERNEQLKKLLNDRKLVDIKDVEVPLPELWDDIPLNPPMESTFIKREIEPKKDEEEEEKSVLTEEEIKANLKLKLEAFNSRMKKNPQPAQPLMPQNIKVEDEI